MAKPSSPGGIVAVSHRALSHALNRDPQMTACEVAWLDDRQGESLILACHHLADTAHGGLSHALTRDPQMTACEVAWLDDGQLERLLLACHHLADPAQAERNGREAR